MRPVLKRVLCCFSTAASIVQCKRACCVQRILYNLKKRLGVHILHVYIYRVWLFRPFHGILVGKANFEVKRGFIYEVS